MSTRVSTFLVALLHNHLGTTRWSRINLQAINSHMLPLVDTSTIRISKVSSGLKRLSKQRSWYPSLIPWLGEIIDFENLFSIWGIFPGASTEAQSYPHWRNFEIFWQETKSIHAKFSIFIPTIGSECCGLQIQCFHNPFAFLRLVCSRYTQKDT